MAVFSVLNILANRSSTISCMPLSNDSYLIKNSLASSVRTAPPPFLPPVCRSISLNPSLSVRYVDLLGRLIYRAVFINCLQQKPSASAEDRLSVDLDPEL